MRVLLLEDQAPLLASTKRGLEELGFTVDGFDHGDEALKQAQRIPYDALVLDIMVPGRDGLSILRSLRDQKRPVPVILLTARSALPEKLEGLNMGADDYLTKPFYIEELAARLQTIVRRNSGETSHLLQVADLHLDLMTREVTRADSPVKLSAREFELLEFFMRTPGRVFSRVQIYEHVWGYGMDLESNLVEVYIQKLRNKIDKNHEQKLLHTIRGAGYKLEHKS